MGPFGEEDSTCWRQAYGVIGILAVTPHSLRPTQLGIMDFVAGGVRERLNRHAWRACVLQKGTVGSNPTPSARLRS